MCVNQKYVHNKYIHKSFLVSCGNCPACLQEKANARAQRIRNHNNGKLCLFLMLSYDNRFVPYIKSEELINISSVSCHTVSVCRDYSVRFYRDKKIIKSNFVVLESHRACDFENYCFSVPELNKKSGCVGVIYWPDVQNFIKRLRINLFRYFGYEVKITYYATGEYGETTHRPHFHLLVYFDEGTKEELSSIIAKSWPYGDMLKSRKRIQIAIDPSSYVASYVTKSIDLPKICESSPIRQKHSHSLYFGANLSAFSLPSLLEKADECNMSYRREVLKDGVPCVVDVPIPKYVINRFFPRFKGDTSFSSSEVLQLLRFPIKLWQSLGDLVSSVTISNIPDCFSKSGRMFSLCFTTSRSCLINEGLLYTKEEFRKFVVHLRNCYEKYFAITGKNIYDYAIDYVRVWKARFAYVFKHSYDEVRTLLDFAEFYENANEFCANPSLSPTLLHPSVLRYECNPNERGFLKRKNLNLTDLYLKKQTIMKVNNFAMSSLDEEF